MVRLIHVASSWFWNVSGMCYVCSGAKHKSTKNFLDNVRIADENGFCWKKGFFKIALIRSLAENSVLFHCRGTPGEVKFGEV